MFSAPHTVDNWFVLRVTPATNDGHPHNPRYVTTLLFNPDLRAKRSRVSGRRLTVTLDRVERRFVQHKNLDSYDPEHLVRILALILDTVGEVK